MGDSSTVGTDTGATPGTLHERSLRRSNDRVNALLSLLLLMFPQYALRDKGRASRYGAVKGVWRIPLLVLGPELCSLVLSKVGPDKMDLDTVAAPWGHARHVFDSPQKHVPQAGRAICAVTPSTWIDKNGSFLILGVRCVADNTSDVGD
jgi:hypothetical protein